MLEIIQYKNIKKYKRYFSFDLNTNSKLYFDKDLIHKIFSDQSLYFYIILKKLDELKLNEIVEIKNLIYKNEFMVGYSMKNYKEYKSLNKFKYRKFSLKKKDCFKLVDSFKILLDNNLLYSDYHLGNVLLNGKTNDIKICDVDGISFKQKEETQYKKILKLLLSYLYNIKEYDIRNVLNSDGIGIKDSIINECCVLEKDLSFDKIIEIITKIKKQNIKEEKKHIIQKSKYLSNFGYLKYMRM